ncbi:MAG: type I restriction-modification system subunit M, partial [Spirochaetaceae bacterium]|nr:type I restriction-modification system subunit M [Spirochaetaceae bacterium]
MPETNTAEIGFEKQIWDAACILRGNMDAAEYKHIVLGLIFLKYISDTFEGRHQALKAEGDGFEEDRDAYVMENIFYVPASARWMVIAAKAHTPEIGKVIDEAMLAIEKENKKLKGVLPKTFARPELDKRRLGDVVDIFTNITLKKHGDSADLRPMDILGRAYEYCLGKFAEQDGKLAGEFYTPACVVRTLVEVLQPFNGRVYDPCCGSGGMFVQSAQFVEHHQGNINNLSIFGQDSNPTTWKLCQMNLAIRGIEANLGEAAADTFFNDLHPTLKADYIMANPPFNLSDWGADKLQTDVRWKYGVPPAGNANFAWLQHMIHHLNAKGRMGMVLANGSLSSQSGGEGAIRQAIIEDDLVEGIIAMPAQLFYTTQIPVSLWFLNKQKARKGKTLFIDARNMGTMISRRLREMTEPDIA